MIENRPILDLITHLVLILGIIVIAFPIWVMFVGATHDGVRLLQVPLPLPHLVVVDLAMAADINDRHLNTKS